MKKRLLLALVLVIAFTFIAQDSFAQGDEGFVNRMMKKFKKEEAPPPKARPALKAVVKPAAKPAIAAPAGKLTKQDLIARIAALLSNRPDILSLLTDVEMVQNEEGGTTFAIIAEDGSALKIEDMDLAALKNLLSRINAEINRINQERLAIQQQQISQQAQRISQQAQSIPQPPPAIPQIPRVHTPPPAPPRTPAGPPAGVPRGGAPAGPPRR